MSRPYSEEISIRPSVTYTPCATFLREQTGDIITFLLFEEGDLISETCNYAKSGDKFNEDSIIPILLSKE